MWYALVWPSLVLNYFGQGAMLLDHPELIENPFYLMAPKWAQLPLVFLSTAATVSHLLVRPSVLTARFFNSYSSLF